MESSKDKMEIQHQVDYVKFDMYDSKTIRQISAAHITESSAFDNLNQPNKGGLHDPKMGVSANDKFQNCSFCGLDADSCPGHFGHIDLPAPIYNPFLLKYIYKLLRCKCFNCHKLKLRKKEKTYIYFKLILIKLGLIQEASSLQAVMYSSNGEPTDQLEKKIREFLSNFSQGYEEELNTLLNTSMEESHGNSNDSVDLNNNIHVRSGSIDTMTNTDETLLDDDKEKKKNKKKDKKKDKEIDDASRIFKENRDQLFKTLKLCNLVKIEKIIKSVKDLDTDKNILCDQNVNIRTILK